MQVSLVHLLLLLPIVALPSTCSLSKLENSSIDPLQQHIGQGIVVEKRLLDAEVPERLKDWSILQDGNKFREGFRSKYTSALRLVDKLRDPYSFSKGIKKEWKYEPDLRKQYVVPRVLRVPLILQDGPIRYKKELAGFIKGTDEELGLQDIAKPHLPELYEEEIAVPKSATSDKVDETRSGRLMPDQRGLRGSARRRGSRPLHRIESFNHFRPAPERDVTLPRTPVPEIDSEASTTPRSHAEGSQRGPLSRQASQGDLISQQSLDQMEKARKAKLVEPLSNTFVGMGDNFKTMQEFQESQIRKAAIRYPGHPEYVPPNQQANLRGSIGSGFAGTRSSTSVSQGVTPGQSQRRFDDQAGVEGDVSNPLTPRRGTTGPFTFEHARASPGWMRSPEIHSPSGDEPSPRVSTPGAWSPQSPGAWTPNTPRTGTHTPTVSTFRLPADYADRLHGMRAERAVQLHSNIANPPAPVPNRVGPDSSSDPSVAWYNGHLSPEVQHRMQEAAKVNDIDYALYHSDASKSGQVASSGVQPNGNEKPSSSTKFLSHDSKQLFPGDERIGDNPSAQADTENTAKTPLEHQRQPSDVSMKDASSPDNVPSVLAPHLDDVGKAPVEEATSSEAPTKKRPRPPRLSTPLQHVQNFFFPTANTELTSPHLKGFKPSLTIKEVPNPDFDPSDPRSSPGLVFRKKWLGRTLSGPLHRFRRIPSFSPYPGSAGQTLSHVQSSDS